MFHEKSVALKRPKNLEKLVMTFDFRMENFGSFRESWTIKYNNDQANSGRNFADGLKILVAK